MDRMNMKRLSLILAAVFLFACSQTTPAPVVIPPEQLGTAIVQTANALASQTAFYAPPTLALTSTFTATVIPSETPTATVTDTPFIIIVPTRTPTITPTRTATGTQTPTKTLNQPCSVAATVPAPGTQFSAGAFFDTVWTVVNTGTVTWSLGNVDLSFTSGTKIHLNGDILDLPSTTAPGQSVALVVHMQAPASKGTYSETWTLHEGDTNYCVMSMSIVVK